MLNEETADRTLPPTERRRREARMRGEVARSSDLTTALLLLTASVALWYFAPIAANALVRLMRSSISTVPTSSLTVDAVVGSAHAASRVILTILAPILLLAMTGGLIASLAQTGWLWVPSAVIPRFRGARFISQDPAISGTVASLRLCAVLSVSTRFLFMHDWQLRSIGLDEPTGMLLQPARLLGELSIQLAFTLVLVALVDYGLRFWRNEQRLKMTVEELRQEQREESGDPQIKKRRSPATV
jgi:flagellar biosynthetic protein FlhB